MNKIIIEALRRLYVDGRVAKEKIIDLHKNGKISPEECDYILAD